MEVVVVTAIVVLIFGAIMALHRDIVVVGRIFESTFASQGEVERAFRQMSSEIRSLGPSAQGAYPVEKAEGNEFIFFRDIQQDGTIERVRYVVEDANLKKGVIVPSGDPVTYRPEDEKMTTIVHTVSEGEQQFFSYYGDDGMILDPVVVEAIRSITISVDVNRSNPSTGQPITLTTHITPRNLMSGARLE